MKLKNYGLIIEQPRVSDYIVGAGSAVKAQDILNVTGDWEPKIPEGEYQNGVYFDTMGCVTFSALNILEMLFKAKFGIEINFSDRFTAKMSGTTLKGNSFSNVAESIRKDGLLLEDRWDYPRTQRTPVFVRDEYYETIPNVLIEEAKKFLNDYEIQYEWVPATKEKLREMLQYAPLQVQVVAWYDKNKDGVYEKPAGVDFNHGTVLIEYPENGKPKIFDSYSPFVKELEDGYDFGTYALKYQINKKDSMQAFLDLFKKKNDTKLVRNQATGEWAWFYNNSLRIPKTVDRKVEALANYLIKKEGANISQEDWSKLPQVEL